MKRPRRMLTSVLTTALMVGSGLLVLPTAAHANQNSLWFRQVGDTTGTYGPNAAIQIWGDLSYKNVECPTDGVPDFVYATSDVYIVVPGTAEGHLVDVTGGAPNTIIQYGSVFSDEVIGITTPAGKLAGGVYDVVFDTCQDGVFQAEDDKVFSRVLTVEIPGDLPAADVALTSLKTAAYDEYESWKQTSRVVNGVWKLVEKALSKGCKGGNPTACALKHGNYFSPIQEQFNGLLLNQGQHYLGIYEDPPNPDFDQAVVPQAAIPSTDAIAGEGALTEALLRSIEAYKGAQAAGNSRWALIHARAVRDLHQALAGQLGETSRQLAELKALYGADADAALDFGHAYAQRVVMEGFTPQERRVLLENGLTAAQITELETDVRNGRGAEYGAAAVRDSLDRVIGAHGRTLTAVQHGYTGWSAIVDALAGDALTPDQHPVAYAGDPYTVVEGSPLSLDATGSSVMDGAAVSAVDWDIDGDRDFNDVAGATPSVTFEEPGSPVIGVRVTDNAGRMAYAWTTVAVTRKGADAVISAATPVEPLLIVLTNSTTTFSVTATDDATGSGISWIVDGAVAGTNESLSWLAPAVPGHHMVTATVTDSDGHRTSRVWEVLVHRADSDADTWTATTDCNDGDAAVHPGRIEVLGNGIDDDCDTGSPDAPPGGLTGTLYGWGENTFGQTGRGSGGGAYNTPQPTVLANDVVQAATGFRTGFAVLADGSVRSWGYNLDGTLGDGSSVPQRFTPGSPTGVGGVGTLSGVTRISTHSTHIAALRADGTVVAWGNNVRGQLGNGSTVAMRNTPGVVLTAADTPLGGVRDVAASEGSVYALMADGTVMAWGTVRCDGTPTGITPYATGVAGLTDIRRIVSGSLGVFFVKNDGTVLSCGTSSSQLGRPIGSNTSPTSAYLPNPVTNLGRGSGIVDLSNGMDSVVALKEDGSVWVWGQNTNSELDVIGLPAGGSTEVPVQVTLPAGAPVVAVQKDESQSTLAIRADGSMLGWGGNLYGVTGTGSSTPVNVPTLVSLPGQVVLQASTSIWNALALTRPVSDPELAMPANWVHVTVADAALSETAGGNFTVSLDHALTDAVTLSWSLVAGTAGAGDATLGTGTVTIPAGTTQAAVAIVVLDDTIDEDDETVTLNLTGAGLGLTIARAQAAGSIADNDDAPSVSVQSSAVVEGGTSLTDIPVRFTLSAASGKEVVVTYATTNGTATAGADYVAATATIRFAPGEIEDVGHLAARGDAILEAAETFTIALRDAVNATAGGPGTVTISDDEILTVSATEPTITEGTAGEFVVTIAPLPVDGVTVSVPWSLVEPIAGNSDAPGDIASASGVLQLTAAQPSAVIAVTAVDDVQVESPEPFRLVLGALSATDGRTVLRGEVGDGWITDNDRANQPPVVNVGDGFTAAEGSTIALSGNVTDDAQGVTSSWSADGPCTVAGVGAQASVTCTDDGTFTVTLTAVDAGALTSSATTTLTVSNVAPVLGDVAADGAGVRVAFADAGGTDTHTCTVEWGDNSTIGVLDGAISPCYLAHAYAAGTFTATITVADGDGGTVTTTRVVTVNATVWPFRGFLSPVNNPPATNVVRAGRAIPIKFGLGGYRGMNIFSSGPVSGRVNCCQGQQPDAVEETVSAGDSALTYNAAGDFYIYVWKTDRAWAGQCRRLIIKLADGTQHWVEFRFR